MSYMDELIIRMFKAGCIKIGDFKLTSGSRSPIYIDLRILPSHPKLFSDLIKKSVEIVRDKRFDLLCGVETGGIPIATALLFHLEKPMIYVRKNVKKHGLEKSVEGVYRSGESVLLIDDVATTGHSLGRAAKTLRENGLLVEEAFVIVDRGQGAGKHLRDMGVNLSCFTNLQEVLEVLRDREFISEDVYRSLTLYVEGSRSV